jgi:hypothetical protein
MVPTAKSPEIEAVLTAIAGTSRQDAATRQVCVACRGTARVFRDSLSRREYQISGLCQPCQDAVFDEQ